MARRKKRYTRRRKKSQRIPLAATIAAISTFTTPCPSGRTILQDAMEGNIEAALYDAREKFAGVDNEGRFRPEWVLQTYTPIIVGGLVSKFAGRLVNKYFDKIPFIGKYIGA